MCGIVGLMANGEFETKKEEKIRQEAMIFLVTELLQLTMARGKDATGLATGFADGDFMGLKMGVSAQEFVSRFGGKETDYDGYLNIWRKKSSPAKLVIGHCRKPSTTVGAGTEDNANNHPIKVGDILGIHNGTLTNHDKIFQNLKCGRDSKVDSEAIFRLLHHLTDSGNEPFSQELLLETCRRLSGNYSVLTFNGGNPYQMAGFRDGRPMVFGLIKPLKLLMVASELDYLKIAVTRYNKMSYLYMSGANKFPPLKKGDVEFANTEDDSIFLFDITRDITPESTIAGLHTTVKVPRTNKIWSGKANTTTGTAGTTGYNRNRNVAGGAGAKKTEVNANRPATGGSQASTQTGTSVGQNTAGGSKAHRLGMAWNRVSNMFEDVTGAKKTRNDHGAVVIDVDAGVCTQVTNPNKVLVSGEKKDRTPTSSNGNQHTMQKSGSLKGFEIRKTSVPVDDLMGDPTKITVVEVADPTVNTSRSSGNGGATTGSGANVIYAVHKGGKMTVPSTELSTDGRALEKALEATEDVPNFSTDTELADAIDVTDIAAMNTMPRYSLANRIKRFFYKNGWYDGFLAGRKGMTEVQTTTNSVDKYARTMLQRVRSRARKSQETIRAMKVLTLMFSEVLEEGSVESRDKLTKAVYDAYMAGKELKPDVLEKVFRQGDKRDNPTVSLAIEAMKEVRN